MGVSKYSTRYQNIGLHFEPEWKIWIYTFREEIICGESVISMYWETLSNCMRPKVLRISKINLNMKSKCKSTVWTSIGPSWVPLVLAGLWISVPKTNL